jgi:hypothetical protein
MNELVKIEQSAVAIPNGYENYFDIARYEQIGRIANVFAKSDLVPKDFKGNPNNCFIAIHMAMRLNIDPLLCIQNVYLVNGNPGLSAKLCISLANRSGVFADNIVFTETGSGDDLVVTANAKLKSNGQFVSKTMSLKEAHAAGWTGKPVWKSQPGQMLSYRTATQLIRLYAPDAILGMTTVEEWEDVSDGVQQRVSAQGNNAKAVNELLAKTEVKSETVEQPKEEKPARKAPAAGVKKKQTEEPKAETEIKAEDAKNGVIEQDFIDESEQENLDI